EALAQELGVSLEIVLYSSAEALNHSASTGAWDITFTRVEDQRESLVDFGPAYVSFEATYLVPASSVFPEHRGCRSTRHAGLRNPGRRIGTSIEPDTEERKVGSRPYAGSSLRANCSRGGRCHRFPTYSAGPSC